MTDIKNVWAEAFSKRGFVIQFVFFLIAILIVVSFLPYFFHSVIGPKPGIRLHDDVLSLLILRDNSWMIFGFIYLALTVVIQGVIRKPDQVLLGLQSYLIITVLRMLSMYVFTLEPPEGIIPLTDPLIDRFVYGGIRFEKDLFFSGHVATLSLLTFLEQRVWVKRLMIAITVIVAILILMQRVHYTIDVLVAPMATSFVIYGLRKWWI